MVNYFFMIHRIIHNHKLYSYFIVFCVVVLYFDQTSFYWGTRHHAKLSTPTTVVRRAQDRCDLPCSLPREPYGLGSTLRLLESQIDRLFGWPACLVVDGVVAQSTNNNVFSTDRLIHLRPRRPPPFRLPPPIRLTMDVVTQRCCCCRSAGVLSESVDLQINISTHFNRDHYRHFAKPLVALPCELQSTGGRRGR